MQKKGAHETSNNTVISHNFGDRAKAARTKAAMTQDVLNERLKNGFGIEKLGTGGITRIEAGTREPRLREALAIAAVLGFEINDLLAPTGNLDRQIGEIADLLSQTRQNISALLLAAGEITEYAMTNPDSLGGEKLEHLIAQMIDRCQTEIHPPPTRPAKVAAAADKVRHQLLQAAVAELPGGLARLPRRGSRR